MRTRAQACCSRQTFATEAEARRRLDRIVSLGVSRVLPMGVERCRNGWHLKFPVADTGPSVKLRALVEGRDKVCVRCGVAVPRDEDSLHHRIPRGRGGENAAVNLILLCGSGVSGCHGWVEKHRTAAYRLGYLVPTGIDPADVPVTVAGRGWSYPTSAGAWIAPEEYEAAP